MALYWASAPMVQACTWCKPAVALEEPFQAVADPAQDLPVTDCKARVGCSLIPALVEAHVALKQILDRPQNHLACR